MVQLPREQLDQRAQGAGLGGDVVVAHEEEAVVPLDQPEHFVDRRPETDVRTERTDERSGQRPFDQGGDPVNDAQRYQAMEAGTIDPSTAVPEDIRMVLAVGPRDEPLAPGESITVDVAFVVGETEEALLANAASAVKLAKPSRVRRALRAQLRGSTALTSHSCSTCWRSASGAAVADGASRCSLTAPPPAPHGAPPG